MNILFVVPSFPNRVSEYLILPSIELCIQSSILKKMGHNVELFDMKINNSNVNELISFIKNKNYTFNLILIDDDSRSHCTTKILLPKLKELQNDTLIGLRGEIASALPEITLDRNPELDFVLIYDDDYALSNLIRHWGNEKELNLINNIAFRKNGIIIKNNILQKYYDINTLPYPDRNLYDIKEYLKRDSETIVKSSRGCPGNCLFCVKTKMEPFQIFSIQRFCDEIEELIKMGFESFFFSDDTFAFSDKRIEEFANEVKKRNLKIKWTSNIRIKDINDNKIKLMRSIGAYRVFVGIETINEETSKQINKKLTNFEIKEKLSILKKYGMEYHASFILGNPNDTEKDLENLVEFVKEIKPTLVTFNLIKVFPGTPIYSNPEKYGIILKDKYWYEKDDWSHQIIAYTKNLSAEKLKKWSKHLLFEFVS